MPRPATPQAAARTSYNPRPPSHREGRGTNPIILMNTPTESAVREAVESYVDPYLGLELRAAGALRGLQLDAERLQITLALGFPARRYRDELAAAIEQRVRPLAGNRRIGVEVEWQVAAHTAVGKQRPVQGIRNIIAVASGRLARRGRLRPESASDDGTGGPAPDQSGPANDDRA